MKKPCLLFRFLKPEWTICKRNETSRSLRTGYPVQTEESYHPTFPRLFFPKPQASAPGSLALGIFGESDKAMDQVCMENMCTPSHKILHSIQGVPKLKRLHPLSSRAGVSNPSSPPLSQGCNLLGTGLHSRRWAGHKQAKLHLWFPITSHHSHYLLNHLLSPLLGCVEKLSSTKLVPGVKKVGDCCSSRLGTYLRKQVLDNMQILSKRHRTTPFLVPTVGWIQLLNTNLLKMF